MEAIGTPYCRRENESVYVDQKKRATEAKRRKRKEKPQQHCAPRPTTTHKLKADKIRHENDRHTRIKKREEGRVEKGWGDGGRKRMLDGQIAEQGG